MLQPCYPPRASCLQVLADAGATRGLRDGVFARGAASTDLAALAAANDAVLTRQYYSTVLASTQGTRLLIGAGDELRPTLLAVLPACRCIRTDGSADGADGADGACGAEGWCWVGGGACRGTDGKLASYMGPNATQSNTTEVSWWAYCS